MPKSSQHELLFGNPPSSSSNSKARRASISTSSYYIEPSNDQIGSLHSSFLDVGRPMAGPSSRSRALLNPEGRARRHSADLQSSIYAMPRPLNPNSSGGGSPSHQPPSHHAAMGQSHTGYQQQAYNTTDSYSTSGIDITVGSSYSRSVSRTLLGSNLQSGSNLGSYGGHSTRHSSIDVGVGSSRAASLAPSRRRDQAGSEEGSSTIQTNSRRELCLEVPPDGTSDDTRLTGETVGTTITTMSSATVQQSHGKDDLVLQDVDGYGGDTNGVLSPTFSDEKLDAVGGLGMVPDYFASGAHGELKYPSKKDIALIQAVARKLAEELKSGPELDAAASETEETSKDSSGSHNHDMPTPLARTMSQARERMNSIKAKEAGKHIDIDQGTLSSRRNSVSMDNGRSTSMNESQSAGFFARLFCCFPKSRHRKIAPL